MKYSGHRKLLCESSTLSKLNAFILLDTRGTLMHLSCLQIPPRVNRFLYVRRVYTTAINFPCISALLTTNYWIADLCFLVPAFILSVEDDVWSLQYMIKNAKWKTQIYFNIDNIINSHV